MEISNEVKSKVFAQYLGQEILIGETIRGKKFVTGFTLTVIAAGQHASLSLLLKPLSAITAEDASAVKLLTNPTLVSRLKNRASLKKWIKNEMMGGNISGYKHLFSYQYLISKGYDLPNFLLNGKTLFESGLCIYE